MGVKVSVGLGRAPADAWLFDEDRTEDSQPSQDGESAPVRDSLAPGWLLLPAAVEASDDEDAPPEARPRWAW
jgi:hypothetical protein